MVTKQLYKILEAPCDTGRNIAIIKVKMIELERMMLPGAIRYDKDAVQSSPQDPMLAFAEKMDELNRQLEGLESKYINEYQTVEKLIEPLDTKHKGVLTLKYLAGFKPEEIANKLSYAESYVYKLQREAIQILEDSKEDSKSQQMIV